jgi:hypothetical protein
MVNRCVCAEIIPKPVLKWTDALVLEKFGKRKKWFNILSLKIFSRRDASVQFRMCFGISCDALIFQINGIYWGRSSAG